MVKSIVHTTQNWVTEELKPKIPISYNRYIDISLGKGMVLLAEKPNVPCLLNDVNKDVIEFYKNINTASFQEQINGIAQNWLLLNEFSELSSKEIYISFLDFLNNIINQDDIQFMVRAIVLMNTDIEKYHSLFSNAFTVSPDMFINALIKAVVTDLSKLKHTATTFKENEIPPLFTNTIETALKTGFFNHFQNLINWQKTDLIDCIDSNKHLAIWYYISQTAKGNRVNYDENGNLKNQYGGTGFNQTNIEEGLQMKKSDSFFNLLDPCKLFNLSYIEFLHEIKPQNHDFIIADLRLANQFVGPLFDLKQKNTYLQLIEELTQYKAKWMLIMECDCLMQDIVEKFNVFLHIETTEKKEIAIITNYR